MEIQQERFKQIVDRYKLFQREKIGTLNEKTIHAVLKNYFEENPLLHEVKVGPYYADICSSNEIYEIQTRSFDHLRKKLEYFLNDYDVYIIYPIPYMKELVWVEQETGEESVPRKSPKKGTNLDAIKELYKIKMFLNHPRIHLKLVLMNLIEFRYLNGYDRTKKRGSTRIERIPSEIIKIVDFDCKEDYFSFLPPCLPITFSSFDLAKEAKITRDKASLCLNILAYIGTIKKMGKEGNRIIYTKNYEEDFYGNK